MFAVQLVPKKKLVCISYAFLSEVLYVKLNALNKGLHISRDKRLLFCFMETSSAETTNVVIEMRKNVGGRKKTCSCAFLQSLTRCWPQRFHFTSR